MNIKDVKKVGIVGCGTMGPTIAAAVALKYSVVVKELNKGLAKRFSKYSTMFSRFGKKEYNYRSSK